MRNLIIKTEMLKHDVRGWEVAKHILHVTEPTYYRKLRDELPEDEQRKIAAQIEAYAAQRGGQDHGASVNNC